MKSPLMTYALVLLAGHSGTSLAGDLADIYQQALRNDPQLKSAEANYRAGSEALPQARAGLLPQASLTADTRKIDTDTTEYNNHGYTVSLTQPVFDASSWFTFKQGQILTEQALTQFELAQQSLIQRTVEAYLGVLNADSQLETALAQERAIKRRLDQVNAQFEVGLIASTDVQEAQATYDNALVTRISAQGDLDNSYEALERLSGESYQRVASLSPDYPIAAPVPAAPEEWLEKAWQGNLSLKIARYGSESARRAAQAARSDHLPVLSLTAGHDYDSGNLSFDDQSKTDSIGLTLSVPLYSGGATESRSRQLQYSLQQAQFDEEDALRNVTQTTRSLLRNLNTNALRVDALKQSIRSSELALKATEEGYRVGTRNVVDVLQAEQQLYSAKRDYASARFEFVSNLISFKLQLGTLSPEDINTLDGWLESPTQ
ncbi:TolC family outer membrane protein [Neptuniibacter sp. CAU 1671]|uniref:TolC family outer membrane protein n=1 Tax=Neptuniibacter sp. CAU 1671 TaxID=3032593 RepID=UPI0023DC7A0E|nr:TolC family outer membrane protein [Neptuniibacter sp. CAU 1671]MDF2181079.1 TolC family outer membrane protein [Neptuniibacter sp. CAU 1671]